jgi:Eukaryotic initiation factor 4E
VNAKGGKWVLTINKSDRRNLDDWWLHSILAVIGETLEQEGHEEVCNNTVMHCMNAKHLMLAKCLQPCTSVVASCYWPAALQQCCL